MKTKETVKCKCEKCGHKQECTSIYLMKQQTAKEIDAIIEEHKNCNEFHKVQSEDSPNEYFKMSCLYVIKEEIRKKYLGVKK